MSFAVHAPHPAVVSSASARAPLDTAVGRSLIAPGREAAFLDADFQTTDRLGLVTQLLALAATVPDSSQAMGGSDDSTLWELSVATRLKRLLHCVRDTEGIAALPLRLRCPHADCQQFLEIELALADLDALHNEAADAELLRFPGAGSSPLTFRRPTGGDLRQWRTEMLTTPAASESLFRRLVVVEPGSPVPLDFPPAEACAAAFAEFDSLVAFQVTTVCPHCGRESSLPVDLETLALNRLHAVQQRLYRENHRLALAYGWSETEILSVPRVRRLRYLAHLEGSA